MRRDWQTLRGAVGAYASLKATAEFLQGTLSYIEAFNAAMSCVEVSSERLNALKTRLRDMSESSAIAELREISALFKYETSEEYEWGLLARFNNALELTGANILSVSEAKENGLLKRILSQNLSRRANPGTVDFAELHADEARAMLATAMYGLHGALTAVAGALFELFRGLSREMDFYRTAAKYTAYLEVAKMNTVFPKISGSGEEDGEVISVVDLYDPLLLVEGLTKSQITTNSVIISGRTLIKGANAAGKTSILRAVAMAQLFGGAGLPVCAERAILSVGAVLTQFSRAEELTLNDAGRFEQEVSELAEIVNAPNLHGSLVLLNETFQTTSYVEGAAAIRGILSALEAYGAKWVFVTHLTPLLNDPPTGAATLTMEHFKVIM
jgi:DNA mismatch repair ATPase MutS